LILQADLSAAGLIKREPVELVEIASRALDILAPIQNWPGVARAYAARASAHEKCGDLEQAVKDHTQQKIAESKADQNQAED
jgi:hypothetical protein